MQKAPFFYDKEARRAEHTRFGNPACHQALEAGLNPKHLFLYGLIVVCCVIEGVLSLGDFGMIEPARLRNLAYDNGAFWPGLLDNWKPNYAVQPYVMFVTYGFLHAGLLHLGVNMITLWSLGRAVLIRTSQRCFVIVFTGASLGGALFFALLASGPRPMVGASGALFGLLGTIVAWEYLDHRREPGGHWHIIRIILVLVALNAGLHWAMGGQLAWQAHLGGFLVGWIAAFLIDRSPIEDHQE